MPSGRKGVRGEGEGYNRNSQIKSDEQSDTNLWSEQILALLFGFHEDNPSTAYPREQHGEEHDFSGISCHNPSPFVETLVKFAFDTAHVVVPAILAARHILSFFLFSGLWFGVVSRRSR